MELRKSTACAGFFLIIALLGSARGVTINRLQVPEVIRRDSPVVLDCDYTLEENHQDLVVKWYFNKSLVYQWIPGTKKRPQAQGVLKDRLNLEYVASVDANSRHRALHILRAGPDLSGEYTCKVSTEQSEDEKRKNMTVLVSEKNLILRLLGAPEGLMRVQCLADGVFPKPLMSLHSPEGRIEEAEVESRLRGQLYEVSATATLPAPKDQPQEIACKLHIPQANYTTRKEAVFYPGASSANLISIHQSRWLTVSMCLIALAVGLGVLDATGGCQ